MKLWNTFLYLFNTLLVFVWDQNRQTTADDSLSIENWVPRNGMLFYLHQRDYEIFFHPAKFDNFKDEKISDFKTVSVSQRNNIEGTPILKLAMVNR